MLSRFEVRKDMVQELTESAATRVGRIATILSGAVRDVTHEVGDWFSDAFEMQEAARRAEAERVAAAGGSTADALDDDAPTDAALDDPALDDPALDDPALDGDADARLDVAPVDPTVLAAADARDERGTAG